MDKAKRPFRKSKQRPFHKSKQRPFHKSKRSFRKRLPPIQPGDRIDYRNLSLISRFISDQGKILPRRINKVTLKQQRFITIAIKQARILALVPFVNNDAQVKINKAKSIARKKAKSDSQKDKSDSQKDKSYRKKGRS